MSFNLLEMLKDQVSGQLINQATKALGESESGVTKALGGIFPSLLGSMISKGSDETSAGGLMDMIKGVDPGILDNVGGLLGGMSDDKPDGLMSMGQGLVGGLMGDKMGGAVDLISKFSGIKSGSTMSLFKMAAPFLMGLVSKKVASEGLGVSGLMSMLGDQKDAVKDAMPAGMGGLLGLGNLMGSAKDMAAGALGGITSATSNVASSVGNTASAAADKASNVASSAVGAATGAVGSAAAGAASVANTAKSGGASLFKWLIPALLILGGIYFLTQSSMCKDNSIAQAVNNTIEEGGDAVMGAGGAIVDGAKTVGDATTDGLSKVGAGLSAAFSKVDEAAKSALASISFAPQSAGKQMMTYIEDGGKSGEGVFRFTNLQFESGSARIAGESGMEVDNLAAILKAYPSVKVKVEGHTDSDGEAASNMTLSQARADAVQARLTAANIDASRISTEGFGETNPVADNGTPEGKAQNRRIEVRIID